MIPHLSLVPYTSLHDLTEEVITSGAFVTQVADETPFLRLIPQVFANEPNFYSFLVQDDALQRLGFVLLLPSAEGDPQILEVGPLYLRPVHQNQGLGTQVLSQLIAWARARGTTRLDTQTWGQNQRVRRVFEKLGFVLVREVPQQRVNGDSSVFYRLQLSPLAD